MNDLKSQISDFVKKCEDIKNCKFIMATRKIKDLLKCIVAAPELYRLFEAVTKDFNYPAIKSKCLVTVDDGVVRRSYVVLPQTVEHRLALIFCLFAEFDRDTMNFNDFLRKYFPEDGTYFASYHAFCNMIVDGLKDAVLQVFKSRLGSSDFAEVSIPNSSSVKAEFMYVITSTIAEEQQLILQSNLSEDDKEGGVCILAQLSEAVKSGNKALIKSLVCGYNYFILYTKYVSDSIEPLIAAIAEYGKML